MTIPLTPVEIEFLRRKAKSLQKTEQISHTEALDRLAQLKNYRNWALLVKHGDTLPKPLLSAGPVFQRSAEEMKAALRKVPYPRWGSQSRSEAARQQVADLSGEFVDPRNALAYAIAYMETLVAVPRFKVWATSPAYWELRCWMPYAVVPAGERIVRILVNREYKPAGQTGRDWAVYEEWSNLHLQVSDEALASISHNEQGLGYLYADGNAPWLSRDKAQLYLDRLRRLQASLVG